MLDVHVVELPVLEFPLLAVLDLFPTYVLEEKAYGRGYQVLKSEGWRNGEVAHRDELGLLGVEVDVAANAVDVRVQHHPDFAVVLVEALVLAT